jgi:hypothetical protein
MEVLNQVLSDSKCTDFFIQCGLDLWALTFTKVKATSAANRSQVQL